LSQETDKISITSYITAPGAWRLAPSTFHGRKVWQEGVTGKHRVIQLMQYKFWLD